MQNRVRVINHQKIQIWVNYLTASSDWQRTWEDCLGEENCSQLHDILVDSLCHVFFLGQRSPRSYLGTTMLTPSWT